MLLVEKQGFSSVPRFLRFSNGLDKYLIFSIYLECLTLNAIFENDRNRFRKSGVTYLDHADQCFYDIFFWKICFA